MEAGHSSPWPTGPGSGSVGQSLDPPPPVSFDQLGAGLPSNEGNDAPSAVGTKTAILPLKGED